jgi:colicin import membrane protein
VSSAPGYERPSDRWISITLSVLLHGALLGALVYGFLIFREQRRAAPQPAIQATVVDARTLRGAEQPAPQPAAAPQPVTPPEDVGPPPPTPEERAEREREEQAQRQAQEQKAAEEKAAQERAQQERVAAEKAAAAKVAAQKAAAEKAAAARRAAEEKQRKQQEEEDRREREADLKRSLAAEEHASTARSGAATASWVSMIQGKIEHAWLRPPTARPGIDCMLHVTQVPGGEVTQVSIGQCNGDQAVRESIEAAVYRASPLPPPPDPSVFDRTLDIRFRPQD